MNNRIAVPAEVAAVFGTPGELDSTDIIWNLVRLQAGNALDEVLLNLFEWVRDVLDSSLTTQTDEEHAHLIQSIRLVEAVLTVGLADDGDDSDEDDQYDGELPLPSEPALSDEEWRAIPGFFPEATEVELQGGWRLYIPMGIGVPTLRHIDSTFDFVIPIPGPMSWSLLSSLEDLRSHQTRGCTSVFLGETLRLYVERDDHGTQFEFRHWNAGNQDLPFRIDEPLMDDLVASVREAILWLSVYSVGPASEGDILRRQASEFVNDQPEPAIVPIKTSAHAWQYLLLMCDGDEGEAAASFVDYHLT